LWGSSVHHRLRGSASKAGDEGKNKKNLFLTFFLKKKTHFSEKKQARLARACLLVFGAIFLLALESESGRSSGATSCREMSSSPSKVKANLLRYVRQNHCVPYVLK
jgi:hypothetical protein